MFNLQDTSVSDKNRKLIDVQDKINRQIASVKKARGGSMSDEQLFDYAKSLTEKELSEKVYFTYRDYTSLKGRLDTIRSQGKGGPAIISILNSCQSCSPTTLQTILGTIETSAYAAQDYSDLQNRMNTKRNDINASTLSSTDKDQAHVFVYIILYYAQFDYDDGNDPQPMISGEGAEDVSGNESEFQSRRRCGWFGSICVAVNVAIMAAAAGILSGPGGALAVGSAFFLIAKCCYCYPWTCSGISVSC